MRSAVSRASRWSRSASLLDHRVAWQPGGRVIERAHRPCTEGEDVCRARRIETTGAGCWRGGFDHGSRGSAPDGEGGEQPRARSLTARVALNHRVAWQPGGRVVERAHRPCTEGEDVCRARRIETTGPSCSRGGFDHGSRSTDRDHGGRLLAWWFRSRLALDGSRPRGRAVRVVVSITARAGQLPTVRAGNSPGPGPSPREPHSTTGCASLLDHRTGPWLPWRRSAPPDQ